MPEPEIGCVLTGDIDPARLSGEQRRQESLLTSSRRSCLPGMNGNRVVAGPRQSKRSDYGHVASRATRVCLNAYDEGPLVECIVRAAAAHGVDRSSVASPAGITRGPPSATAKGLL